MVEFNEETFDFILKVLGYTGAVVIPFALKGIADVREVFHKIDEAKKPDSDGGEKITADELADIIGDAGVVAKFILNGIKAKFTKKAVEDFKN